MQASGFSGVVADEASGHAALAKVGAGTLILSGASTYTGGATISSGVLELAHGDPMYEVYDAAETGAITLAGGTLQLDAPGQQLNNAVTIPSGSTGAINVHASQGAEFAGPLTVNGALTLTSDMGGDAFLEVSAASRTGSLTLDGIGGFTVHDDNGELSSFLSTAASVTASQGAILRVQSVLGGEMFERSLRLL